MTRSIQVGMPDQIIKQASLLVSEGWAENLDEIVVDALRSIAGKRVPMIDTCYSGALWGTGGPRKGAADTSPDIDRLRRIHELARAAKRRT